MTRKHWPKTRNLTDELAELIRLISQSGCAAPIDATGAPLCETHAAELNAAQSRPTPFSQHAPKARRQLR
jgi:hypothetical protein